ncbi:MAG: hypothetical protein M9887_12100 [Chitinophagales bacterium]|nr:hypothetical protein [Chitinophagales bacterium]
MQYNIKQCFKLSYILVLFILVGCNSTKHLKDNEYLLSENSFRFDTPSDTVHAYKSISKAERKRLVDGLENLVAQKPNNSFLVLFKPRLFFYNATTRPKKEARREAKGKSSRNRMSEWLHTKIGEAPVIFDSTLLSSSENKMKNFMINEGYFNTAIDSKHLLNRKKAKVNYIITPKNRFYFNHYFLEIEDSDIEKVVKENMSETFIIQGEPYTTDALKSEQERIASVLNNRGFFSFSKNNITFEVDTSGSSQYKDIYIQIPDDDEDLARKQYKVGNITFNINYANTGLKRKKMEIDTLRGIQLIYSSKDIRPDIITQSIFYQVDSTFKKDDYQKTISRLNELGIFRFVNIKYNPLLVSQTEGYIDTDIVAELRKRQSGKVDLELNTDARDKIGAYVNFTYTNKNIFKRADRLQFNTSGGVEFQVSQTERNEKNNSRISNINWNVSSRLYFPKIFPELANKAQKNNYRPIENFKSTFINLGYNLQKKIGYYSYMVNTFNIGYGYDIRGKRFRHEIQPLT